VHKVRTQYCLVDRAELAAVLEASGDWHAPYDTLCASGVPVKLAHPAPVKAIAAARIKTDRIDARILAHLLRTDLIPEAWASPPAVRELRDLVWLRWGFISARTQAKNRIHALLTRAGLRAPTSDLFERAGRQWLAAQPMGAHTRALVAHQLQHIEETTAHAEALTRALEGRRAGSPAREILQTMPGVGVITAATLLAELGDWRRFAGPKQVAAYFGLVPTVRASARAARYGQLTKQGSGHARRALVEAAHVAIRLPGPARVRYSAVLPGRGKKVALVAAARTVLVVAWTLLLRGERYRPAA
jgi:transposase